MSIELIEAQRWRDTIAERVDGGMRFAGAWASGEHWRVALTDGGHVRVLSCAHANRRVPTIVDLVPAADWDEREAHDLRGLDFDGHDPMRALSNHPDVPEAWATPVTGDGVHHVAVGPIHAGVIESGHFRFGVVGERILALDLRLFYKHRGLERAAEGHTPQEALAHVQRACAACAAASTTAYAHAVEDALGLWSDRDLSVGRTIVLELERIYNHLHDISAICAGVGFAPGTMAFAALKDRAQQIQADLVGHRFLFGTIAIGRGAFTLDRGSVDQARGQLGELRADAAGAWRDLEFAGSLQARLDGVGVLDHDHALRLGAVGPVARASGVHMDTRTDSPRLFYGGGFTPAAPRRPTADVAARLELRATELETSFDLLDDLLAGPVPAGAATQVGEPHPIGIGRTESPRGTTLCAVELGDGRVRRLHLRTGSYANWPSLAHAVPGNLLPDFPLINKSFELCYACVDR